MGLIRKTLAVGSVGVVRPKSKKQRSAAAIQREAHAQTELLRQQNAILAASQAAQAQATGAAPGYYHAEGDPADVERLWDGEAWTTVTRQASARGRPKHR